MSDNDNDDDWENWVNIETRKLCPMDLDTRLAEAGQCVDDRYNQ